MTQPLVTDPQSSKNILPSSSGKQLLLKLSRSANKNKNMIVGEKLVGKELNESRKKLNKDNRVMKMSKIYCIHMCVHIYSMYARIHTHINVCENQSWMLEAIVNVFTSLNKFVWPIYMRCAWSHVGRSKWAGNTSGCMLASDWNWWEMHWIMGFTFLCPCKMGLQWCGHLLEIQRWT